MLFLKRPKINKKYIIMLTIIFVLVLIISFYSYTLISKNRTVDQIEKNYTNIKKIIDEKLDHLLEYSIQISKKETIQKFILNKDASSISGTLNEEMAKEDIQTMLVTNSSGEVITRVPSKIRKGDNAFITYTFGRQALKEGEVKTFDYGKDVPLLMVGGKLIKENNQIIGAIFSGQKMDNEYAQYLKENELDKSNEIIFYTEKKGIVASSFENEKMKQPLSSYYNNDTYDLKNQIEVIRGINILGKQYISKAIKLYNPEGETIGSIIIFHGYNFSIINLLLSIFNALFLSGLLFLYFKHIKNGSMNKKVYLLLIIVALSSCIVIFMINKLVFENKDFPRKELNGKKYTIYNSTISLNPDFDVIYNDTPHTISIEIDSGGEAINAIESILKFDPQKIQIRNVIYTRSICDSNKFIEKEIDNNKGLLSIACIIPSPGFLGYSGLLADVVIEKNKNFPIGEAIIEFDKQKTKILANDGLGTNVLRKSNGGYYVIINNENIAYQNYLTIYSYTHPNQYTWYNQSNIHLNWLSENSKYNNFLYKLDQNPFTSPTRGKITMNKEINLKVYEDGIYYFHLGRLGDKNEIDLVSHFKINVDSSPPRLINYKL